MNKKHGHYINGKPTPEITAWKNMKQRCYDSKREDFYLYGGRGIKVCEKWLNSFENFFKDMGKRPSPTHSIDRYPDVNGDYEPSNCRWATKREQRLNVRPTNLIEYKGQYKTIKQWCSIFNLRYGMVALRLWNGEPIESALQRKSREPYLGDGVIGVIIYKVKNRISFGCNKGKKDIIVRGEVVYDGDSLKEAAKLLGVTVYEIGSCLNEKYNIKTFNGYCASPKYNNSFINHTFGLIKKAS